MYIGVPGVVCMEKHVEKDVQLRLMRRLKKIECTSLNLQNGILNGTPGQINNYEVATG